MHSLQQDERNERVFRNSNNNIPSTVGNGNMHTHNVIMCIYFIIQYSMTEVYVSVCI